MAKAPSKCEPKFPPIPRTLQGVLARIVVTCVPGYFAQHTEFGQWEFNGRKITVAADIEPRAQWHTLYHEWVHAALEDCGVKLTKDQEEAVCDAIATARVRERFG